jgi:cysteine synthase B
MIQSKKKTDGTMNNSSMYVCHLNAAGRAQTAVGRLSHPVNVISPVDLASSIGHTPLFRLAKLSEGLPSGVEVYAKGEHLNPGGSVKDRAAYAMILDGLCSGKLTRSKIILDATSGNTGIAYAMIGSSLGYRVTVCLPANASPERKRILRAYGANIIETNPLQSTDEAQAVAKMFAERTPWKYFYPDQYNNPANWQAHYEGTAPEIWQQTDGRITHFVAGIGTSGTFIGTTRRLKELKPSVRAVSLQPDSPLHGLEGMKHMQTARVPGIYDPSVADEQTEVSTEDAQKTCRLLAREEGLFVGVSSGANVFAALRLARTLPAGSVVVTILCDNGNRYLNESFWEDAD